MKFIERLDITADLEQMKADLNALLKICPWPKEDFVKKSSGNQIGISHRPNAEDIWLDASGSLVNKETGVILGTESDFTEINPNLPEYTKQTLSKLANDLGVKFGRIRYMRLMPKSGLSIHSDFERRIHFVLDTNQYSLFGQYYGTDGTAAECFHIPADGHFYKVDTTRPHFVFNGGWQPRIHLVICIAD